MSSIQTVSVVGAGQMGSGIAQTAAAAGYDVRLFDRAGDRAAHALAAIAASLTRQVDRGQTTQAEADAILARITMVSTLVEAAQSDLVIEAVPEVETAKTALLQELSALLPPHAIIASNTSSIEISKLAAATDRQDRVIGLHFMKPATSMRLVEVIRGLATSAETYEIATAFAHSLGKTTTESNDFPAFIVNRILVPMINEAIYALHEGVGDVKSIDTALKLGANHPMGPLELADFMGLDVVLAIMNVLHESRRDDKYRPCPLLEKYVGAGWLGRKSGRGFYDYSGEEAVPTR
ncbi:MAG: 3-hydroxybutyryl-CoA dehydrogenase [Brevundimonas sp.]|nr:MAG: 3-hydroxybutyryl-CoA dehydrogenase [Brevundimonas sp.]